MAGAALMALAGCGPPRWRDPATARDAADLAPAVARILAPELSARARTLRPDHLTAAALPPPPAWAAPLIGRPAKTLFPTFGTCMGNTDGVKLRYGSGAAGAKIVGWGWDPAVKSPVPRVLLVDYKGVIRGAGETGARRRDVPRAVPSITSQTAGWEATTPLSVGWVDALGVLADGKTVCKLGHADL